MLMICIFYQYNCSLLHLFDHGFVQALLCLSTGSIIHALNDEQGITKMSSTKIITPVSYICIFIGSI